MLRLNSSLRIRSPIETLSAARRAAARLGITRVTDTTRLDRLGIPVFAGIRPGALKGSLCVNAGKGITPIEAQVGAYMEAIEFALAEPGASQVQVVMATSRDVLDGASRPDAILDFCPIVRKSFDPSEPLACVEARDIVNHQDTLVPAELVLLPFAQRHPGTGSFGSHSNGLASGNNVPEATLHGLLEVIERDIRSFLTLDGRCDVVQKSTVPASCRALVERIESAGLDILVRTRVNEFGLPFFEAILFDPDSFELFQFAAGYGCHLVPEIALVRAITEAVQTRLSWIHGGRDDLAADLKDVPHGGSDRAWRERSRTAFRSMELRGPVVDFGAGVGDIAEPASPDDAVELVLDRLKREGMNHVCRTIYTQPDEDLAVVRVTVPRLEHLANHSHRVGPRMRAALRRKHA